MKQATCGNIPRLLLGWKLEHRMVAKAHRTIQSREGMPTIEVCLIGAQLNPFIDSSLTDVCFHRQMDSGSSRGAIEGNKRPVATRWFSVERMVFTSVRCFIAAEGCAEKISSQRSQQAGRVGWQRLLCPRSNRERRYRPPPQLEVHRRELTAEPGDGGICPIRGKLPGRLTKYANCLHEYLRGRWQKHR